MAQQTLTASERILRSRLAAYSQHALHDPVLTTAKARAVFRSSFDDAVDPSRTLPPKERARRGEAAFKAYMTRLALSRSKARRSTKA